MVTSRDDLSFFLSFFLFLFFLSFFLLIFPDWWSTGLSKAIFGIDWAEFDDIVTVYEAQSRILAQVDPLPLLTLFFLLPPSWHSLSTLLALFLLWKEEEKLSERLIKSQFQVYLFGRWFLGLTTRADLIKEAMAAKTPTFCPLTVRHVNLDQW